MQLRARSGTSRGRLLSRARAFEMQGVSLKYPSRSWSGVRCDDGTVVLAVWAPHVQMDAEGGSVLLWAPRVHGCPGGADRASRQERFEHCRLALCRGYADGLLAYGEAADVDPNKVLALRIFSLGDEYWARWVGSSRAVEPSLHSKQRLAAVAVNRLAA